MDIRWKKFSHSMVTKTIVFVIAIFCFTNILTMIIDISKSTEGNFDIAIEESYYRGNDYINDSGDIVHSLRSIITEYKNEEHILAGGTLQEDELRRMEDELYSEFEGNSKKYNPNLSNAENYQIFKETNAAKISQKREELIQEDLRRYQENLRRLGEYQGLIYYASDGTTEVTNSSNKTKEFFQTYPAYFIFDSYKEQVYPEEVKESTRYSWLTSYKREIGPKDVIYVAFTDDFIYPRLEKWQQNKALVTNNINQLAGFILGLAAAFIYLVMVIGRKPEEDGITFSLVDRIYNDFKLVLCLALIALWVGFMSVVYRFDPVQLTFPVTFIIAALGLLLVLSLVKHLKNGTFLKHSLTYTIFAKFFGFFKDVYDSGSVAVKIIVIVVGYPLLVAGTFFIFPITIGAAAWLALKKVKEFKNIKEGVQRVKNGDLQHFISVTGRGEFASLAADINNITDGINKAVANELKSERMKTELITNVSHDIRTPLTSIITYLDLLKNEPDPAKSAEYLEVLEQKAERLKILTDDLFEATKASSGNMPVNFEKLDPVSLITQGLGELDDRISERKLEFRFNHPKDKVWVRADGKLLWRAIENLLSNIFKYAQEGSRVYIDILEQGAEVIITFKNISAYELNISAAELMERFKRGDESRSSQGSGLGLSIAKSLIEIQKGSFNIEIDGDLFKAIIQMTKVE